MKKKKVYLTLQNGKSFQGYRFGKTGEVTGELVFSTGMVGYMETLTDPSSYGQIIVQTFPLIGNYGVMRSDVESDCVWASAYVVREICDAPSNFRSEDKLETFLQEKGVVGIYGVDTRELTKILREEGTMNARISDKPLTEDEVSALGAYAIKNAVKSVAPTTITEHGEKSAKYTLALWDFGAKKSTINSFVTRNCKVIDVPAYTKAEEILSLGVDGIVLADGPGDPTELTEAISEVNKVLGKKPVLGIGLGHQLVALALGGKTKREKYGHRGGNQPVKRLEDGKVYISSQNHGYSVIAESIKEGKVTFVNVNDGSCEGIEYPEYNAMTVQFVPETCRIGNDESPLLEKFFALMEKEKENA